MKKINTELTLICALLLTSLYTQAQQTIAQPYYGEGKIRFYNKANPVAGSPCYTLDISADINTNWSVTQGINAVLIYHDKLFVSIDAGNSTGGVLVYNYSDVYPSKTGGPVSVIKPQTTTGLPVAGITIQPSTGNLFIGTFYTGSDAGIYTCTATSGYANSSITQFASYNNDASVDKYIANLAFDAAGNLWFTEFDAPSAANQFLICYKGANKSNYYKIINPATKDYTATSISGAAGTSVYLLSQPEGLVFDATGNLWLGNNNDDYLCNNAGDGTLVKINAAWITGTLFAQAYGSSNTVPVASTTVDYISGGKLGGLCMDGNTLYMNDQGQNQGTNYASSGAVWKYNITTVFNTSNFTASGIHTTYPGNGLMALDNAQFSVAGDCATGISAVSQSDMDISVYPNPVNNSLFVKTTGAATIEIYNVVGELVKVMTNSNGAAEINTSSFASGIYFAKVQFADGTSATRKFVKE
jgi:hypothetical protein